MPIEAPLGAQASMPGNPAADHRRPPASAHLATRRLVLDRIDRAVRQPGSTPSALRWATSMCACSRWVISIQMGRSSENERPLAEP